MQSLCGSYESCTISFGNDLQHIFADDNAKREYLITCTRWCFMMRFIIYENVEMLLLGSLYRVYRVYLGSVVEIESFSSVDERECKAPSFTQS